MSNQVEVNEVVELVSNEVENLEVVLGEQESTLTPEFVTFSDLKSQFNKTVKHDHLKR